jgi:oligopeptide/dipeptide ABC transporter ATP-binding protein
MSALLEITDYRLAFDGFEGRATVLDGISLTLVPGETVGIVGETGCGKSVLARSIPRLIEMPPARVLSGSIRFAGEDVFTLSRSGLARLRGHGVAMIFQDPMSYLNPLFTIGRQLSDVIRAHDRAAGLPPRSRAAVQDEAVRLIDAVRLPDASRLLDAYPHALSGGMRQRVLIAMALTGQPKLLIADEPTTALDVTIQAQVLALIADLVDRLSLTLMLISHDLGVIGAICQRVVVMYAGTIVEEAPVAALFDRPRHPYTQGLLAAVPDVTRPEKLVRGIPGQIPSALAPPSGCRFHPRCALADDRCRREAPVLRPAGPTRVACHHADTSP